MVNVKSLMNLLIAALIGFAVSTQAICGEKKKDDDHDHKAPHGGTLLEIGEHAGHLELVHDENAGKVTLYILDAHAEKEVAIKDAPKLNLKGKGGKKQLETKAVDVKDGLASKFEATDDALKADPLEGRIVVVFKDKKYNLDLKEHDHDHKK